MRARCSVSGRMSQSLQEIRHYGPVTALKVLSSGSVVAGYGPFLRLFRRHENALREVWRTRVFRRNKIHCIAVSADEKYLALAGGRSFRIVDLEARQSGPHAEKGINEWIIALAFLHAGPAGSELLLLNSHNEVLRVLVGAGHEYSVRATIHCGEKSLLYSGCVTQCRDGSVLVAAGTVMNGVLVWDLEKRRIVHHLTDHEGSIFQAVIDPLGQFLATCSDDRSIKLYGLGSGRLLATGWGHGSRIWSLFFGPIPGDAPLGPIPEDAPLGIFSTGEDCTVRYWHYTGQPTLDQVACFPNCHEGKHVWSGDASWAQPGTFVTGGADGKIRLMHLDTACRRPGLLTLSQNGAQATLPHEYIKQFAEVALDTGFFVVTSLGNCFFHSSVCGWQPVDLGVHAAEFSPAIAKSIFDLNVVKLFSNTGAILSLHFGVSEGLMLASDHIPEKGHSIPTDHFIPEKNHSIPQNQSLAKERITITQNYQPSSDLHTGSGPSADAELVKPQLNLRIINVLTAPTPSGAMALLVESNRSKPFSLKTFDGDTHTQTTILERPDPRVFIPTHIYHDVHTNWLFVGSRHGNLAMYDMALQEPEPQVFWKFCPGDTITSISHVQSSADEFVGLFTVRDGVYKVVRFRRGQEPLVLMENKFPRGSIEGGFMRNNEMLLYGFRSSSFFVWNETNQMELAQAFCAGAHREWRFLNTSIGLWFNYLSKIGLNTRAIDCSSYLVSPGTHGREIRSIALLARAEAPALIATASEDASVKFGTISETGLVKYTATMRNHVSGLQKVAFLNSHYAISSAANEELILWRVSGDGASVCATEEARLHVHEETPDLRIMDFSTTAYASGFVLAAIYSNSQIKLFKYDGQFELLALHVYSTVCLLNVELLHFEGVHYMVVGATDGCLTVWDLGSGALPSGKGFEQPLISQELHQSGIKAMHTQKSPGGFRIITGGDDNSLLSCTLSLANGASLIIDLFEEKAASATITGIASWGLNHVLVTSVDQKVRVWNHQAALRCVAEAYTTVADTGCCATIDSGGHHLGVVGGAGLSVFACDTETSEP